jgi:hypothetical protein
MLDRTDNPLAIDLFCGLGGWTDGLLAAGYDVIGFDIERHVYGEHRYSAQLVIQDVRTLHGAQFRNATLIVASPPCQKYSYMAMPWKRSKAMAAAIRADTTGQMLADLNELFDACFRIQAQASLAAGRHIPMVVENVRGAQPWVGRSRWAFGSYHLWGDVPALMPSTSKAVKVGMGSGWYPPDHPKHVKGLGFNTHADRQLREGRKVNPDGSDHGQGSWFAVADSKNRGSKNTGGSWFAIAHNTTSGKGRNPDGRKTPGAPHIRDGERHTRHLTNPGEHEGIKQYGSGAAWFDEALNKRRRDATATAGMKTGNRWFGEGNDRSPMRQHHSKLPARKFASAMIARIPTPLARHIAKVYRPC